MPWLPTKRRSNFNHDAQTMRSLFSRVLPQWCIVCHAINVQDLTIYMRRNHSCTNTSASKCIATTSINQRHQPAHQHIFVAYIRNMLKHSECEKRHASVANWWLIIHISINTDITSIIITTKSSTIVVLFIRQYENNANNKKNINKRNTTSTKIGNV